MEQLKNWLKWLDKHILTILVIGFMFIIPLYPKLPFKMINYTYVAIRLEDFYLVLISLVYGIQLLRKKVVVPWRLFFLFLTYWIMVFISYLWGYYVQESVIINQLGFLHSLRRIEYMVIFFIAYSTVRSKKDLLLYLKIMFLVLGIVSLYGYGQKFLGWPAVQTMNPEYAKGYLLVLEAWARVSSTFAGHYDLAAYLILLMPIVIGYYLYSNKHIYFGVFLLSLGTLVLTASRASYISYLLTIVPYLLMIRKFKLLVIILVATAIMTPLSDNLANRLTRTFQPTKVFIDSETGKATVARQGRPDDLPPGDFGSGVNEIPIGSDITPVDPETAYEAKKQIREAIIKEAEQSGKTYSPEEINEAVDSIFNRQIPITKYLPDISVSTRLQSSWPRAFAAFQRNMLLGTGPSSLGEATDGDYLRWLGETGLLGTLTFLAILGTISWKIYRSVGSMARKYQYIFLAFIFGFIGVFINAGYIDIFEASKFAYIFWLVAGIFYAALPYFITHKTVDKLKI